MIWYAPKLQSVEVYSSSFIVLQFTPEGNAWYGIPQFNLLEQNITVPGLSPILPDVHCTGDSQICQVITGEGEINAASTITSLVYSPLFDLNNTYFLIAGIAGISPKVGTIGSVTFARYAVQVALQYEFDAREKPADFPTGYVPLGSRAPDQYPGNTYGTEVLEVNDDLRQAVIRMLNDTELFDDEASQEYRANYANTTDFAPGAAAPAVYACDTATSDNYWAGSLLAGAFENTTTLFTNGTGEYCTAQQEDNATLEALLRGAITGLLDFSRVIIMRTASDFDRPYAGQTAANNLFNHTGGFAASIQNLRIAGVQVVESIIAGWNETYLAGIKPTNYIGDPFGSLGGQPDFGHGSVFNGTGAPSRR